MTKAERNAKYYRDNKESILESQRANTSSTRVSKAKYKRLHPEVVAACNQRFNAGHKEDRKRVNHEYYVNHPEDFKARHHIRRTRITQAGGSFTTLEWFILCFAVGFKCLCCGQIKPLEPDHVIPVALGGTSWLWNIQPLCHQCNVRKGTKCMDYRT